MLGLLKTFLSASGTVFNARCVPGASEVTDLARFALELDREGTSDGLVRHSSSYNWYSTDLPKESPPHPWSRNEVFC